VQIDNAVSGTCSAMNATLDKFGALNLFVINAGNQVLHTRQDPPDSMTWTGCTTPGFILPGVQALACGIDGDDHIVLSAVDKNFIQYANYQSSTQNQQWTGWIPFTNVSYPSGNALDYNSDGRLSLFSHATQPVAPPYGGLWVSSQMKLDSTEWELGWTELAANSIGSFVVVRDLTPPN
jgi:hypothetical protein